MLESSLVDFMHTFCEYAYLQTLIVNDDDNGISEAYKGNISKTWKKLEGKNFPGVIK